MIRDGREDRAGQMNYLTQIHFFQTRKVKNRDTEGKECSLTGRETKSNRAFGIGLFERTEGVDTAGNR